MRRTWEGVWFDVAHAVSQRSLCDRAKVGAAIVSASNRIVSTGYNGPAAGFPHHGRVCSEWCGRAVLHDDSYDPAYNDCPSLHAESNALSVCDRVAREGGSIFVTSHVCYGCAKLIANSGLAVVHVLPDSDAPHRNSSKSYEYLTKCGLKVHVAS